ncbi:cation diffusion facilitator family transporter [Actibacterium lipolyticum]|uniref:Cadmium, cobalt and zinc/H(+)-K(+) antiporter n=1 Tax=Actibacterium lipolyticum TaxID=1524263 RepID=A0A238KRP5_9RHOB|nr:cation diffusion facilitator family transporter [Actibacterium lipolyticum]SMX45514.1 Cadmium, cobalt and zinc/H(+)-K(+) antiporter [Actibacterium lipolyticum]
MPHDHHHIDPDTGDRRVAVAVAVNLLLTFAQIVGGVISGSLALIADAIHNFSDAISLIIALVARRVARRPQDEVMTFGYGRAEVVAALVNYTTLFVIAFYLIAEAVMRMLDPPGVDGWIVVIIAGIALAVDAVTAALTYAMSKDSLNIRAAFLHNVADALGSVAVIFAGTLILLYDWRLIDPLVTLGIALYILWHAGREVLPVIRILMLGSPDAPQLSDVREQVNAQAGVEDAHHMHLWQIDEHRTAFEAHLVVKDGADFADVTERVKAMLAQRFNIFHATLELETSASGCADIAPDHADAT